MTTGKTIALTRQIFVGKVMSLFSNMLSRLIITFLPRSKCLLISWLQSPSAVTLEPPKIKSATVSTVSPSICHEEMGPDAMFLVFWMLSFKPTFSLSSLTFIKRLFSSSSLFAIKSLSPPCKQCCYCSCSLVEKTDSWEGWFPYSQPHSCWILGLEFEHSSVCSQGLSFSVLCCIWEKVGTKEDSGSRKARDWFLGVSRTFPEAGDHLC